MASRTPRVLLLGAGRMGAALLEGWLARGALFGPPVVIEPVASATITGLAASGAITLNPDRHGAVDIAVIAVKPQSLTEAMTKLATHLGPDTALLSIVAGKPMAAFADAFGRGRPIVRAMPNTPAAIGQGMTVACASATVSDSLRAQCATLLSAVGEVAWIADEALMDAVTAVSGSGPAYVFYLVECLAAAGVALGLEPGLAMRLARRTVIGSAGLLEARDEDAARLRAEVTSPGGTTEAALAVLMGDAGLARLMRQAAEAARERGRMLATS